MSAEIDAAARDIDQRIRELIRKAEESAYWQGHRDGFEKGHEEGRAAGYDSRVELVESDLGDLVLDLVHKRDVLKLDIGDPLAVLRDAWEAAP